MTWLGKVSSNAWDVATSWRNGKWLRWWAYFCGLWWGRLFALLVKNRALFALDALNWEELVWFVLSFSWKNQFEQLFFYRELADQACWDGYRGKTFANKSGRHQELSFWNSTMKTRQIMLGNPVIWGASFVCEKFTIFFSDWWQIKPQKTVRGCSWQPL